MRVYKNTLTPTLGWQMDCILCTDPVDTRHCVWLLEWDSPHNIPAHQGCVVEVLAEIE